MPKSYEPANYEDALYERWEASGFFTPENLPDFASRQPYTIVLPPPNATGTLHIGHAMMLAIEDAMIRFARMNGRRTEWLPGTDHAAIATQAKVEGIIWKEEKKTRHDLGREELMRRVQDFVEGSRNRIRLQTRKMGASLDWSREAFTLDEPRSRAVRTIFKKMYDDGLIYRGKRVINWCTRCASTLSDDELEHETRDTTLYYFKYAADFPITIATTQPETKLGDAAVAVHPSDARYKKFIGKEFSVAFGGTGGVNLKLKIVGEHTVEPEFGTGALGVTPAHSMVDYTMANTHDLPLLEVIGEDGNMTTGAGSAYANLTIREARAKLVEWLRTNNLIEKEEKISQNVPVCYRCKSEVNPLPKLQWFVGVNKTFALRQSDRHPLVGLSDGAATTIKEVMRHVVETEQVKIIPDRFNKTYFNWVENLRDWCISRQIWYGHRVPVWYCAGGCADPIVTTEVPQACPNCSAAVEQDPDTLDTWFSSGTWTFSTLGWPYTRVIFVRHGEAEHNVQGILDDGTGGQKFGLTKKGKKQVQDLADLLKKENVVEIFSSPLVRAQETAEILTAELGVSVHTDNRLREIGVGKYVGQSDKNFSKTRGPLDKWFNEAPDGIEPFISIKERTGDFLAEILKEYAGRTVVVVSHGDTIAVARNYGTAKTFASGDYPVTGGMAVCEFAPDGSQIGDLPIYHPTDVLETGYDIIFFWVARMILMTTYALGEVPFRTVYLHGLVRDDQGRKMSKSLGNAIDPLDVIPKYGTDAVRLSLLLGQSPGNDLKLSEDKIAGFRNFTNKLWNISRFILSQESESMRGEFPAGPLTELDQWILSRLGVVSREVTDALQKYEFSRAGETLRNFTWDELADWYLEGAKAEGGKHEVLHFILVQLLKLWHPFMPFVTEAIWQEAFAEDAQDFLMIAAWPQTENLPLYPAAEEKISHVKNIVSAIRALRAEYGVAPRAIVPATIVTKLTKKLADQQTLIEKLARCEILWLNVGEPPAGQLATVIAEGTITIPKPEATGNPDEKIRLEMERDEIEHYIARLTAKLNDPEFLARAPSAVVAKEKAKLNEAEEKLAALEKRLGK